MSFKRITIPLSEDEQQVLRLAASRECRRPRDHARFILLSMLGLTEDVETKSFQNANRAGEIRQDPSSAVA